MPWPTDGATTPRAGKSLAGYIFKDRGAVAASTAYSVGDIVLYRGRRILVTTAFTSGTGTEPFISGGNYMSLASADTFWNAWDYGARGDATTDNGPIMNALMWRIWSVYKGGFIQLPQGVMVTGSTWIVPPGIHLLGKGVGNTGNVVGTQIQLKAGSNCDVIQTMTDSSAAQATILSAATGTTITSSQMKNAFYCGLWNLQVHAGKSGQSATDYHHGINITTSPNNTQAAGDAEFDPKHVLYNVYVRSATGFGFYHSGRSDVRYISCVAHFNNDGGFRHSFDTTFDSCLCGFNYTCGWYGDKGSVRWVGCKSYNNGRAANWTSGVTYQKGDLVTSGGLLYYVNVTGSSTTAPASDPTNYTPYSPEDIAAFGAGWYVKGSSGHSWAGCEAQENAGSAWHLKDNAASIIQGFCGSTNCTDAGVSVAASNPNNYAALVLEGASGCMADISCNGMGTSAYALRIVNGTGAPTRNVVRINNDGTGGGALSADSITLAGTQANRYWYRGQDQNPLLIKAGAPVDGDFPLTPPNGTLALDSTNHRLYVRDGAVWKFAALT